MRVVHRDLRHDKIKLVVETLDDLWHLQHLVEAGDIATSLTWRRERENKDKIRPERLEKRRVKLSIKVESVEFHRHTNRLRLLGTIVNGPDVGKHHSFSLGLGSTLTITKTWRQEHLDRIREAVRASRRPRVLLVALDDVSAELALVRQYGLDDLGTISRGQTGKRYAVERDTEKQKFFHRLARAMNEIISRESVRVAIVAGPGFTKDSFAAFLREKYPKLAVRTRHDAVSSGGRTGLYEIVRRGFVERAAGEDRLSLEISLVEQLMAGISRGGLATYGMKEVERAASIGGVEKLLVADELLRVDRGGVGEVLEQTRRTRGKVIVINTEHDAGRQLLALGGVAALLRFKV